MSDHPIETDVKSVKRLMDEGAEFTLIDCRETHEHQTARIDGSVLIPMSEFVSRLGEIETLRESHVVVHCHHGGRSMQVTQYLRQQGFTQVQNMAGGIDAWSLEVDPAVPRY
ncbi:MAG: rhodanese [Planctomycetales bacterium]|nr:rhodanese [Planctomycetales bacterium]